MTLLIMYYYFLHKTYANTIAYVEHYLTWNSIVTVNIQLYYLLQLIDMLSCLVHT